MDRYEYDRLMRKARSIDLQAGRSAPQLAGQLRALAALYRAEAAALSNRAGASPLVCGRPIPENSPFIPLPASFSAPDLALSGRGEQ